MRSSAANKLHRLHSNFRSVHISRSERHILMSALCSIQPVLKGPGQVRGFAVPLVMLQRIHWPYVVFAIRRSLCLHFRSMPCADYVIIYYAHVVCPLGRISMRPLASTSSASTPTAAAEAKLSYNDNSDNEGHCRITWALCLKCGRSDAFIPHPATACWE